MSKLSESEDSVWVWSVLSEESSSEVARVMVKEWLGGAWSLSGEQVRGDDDDGNKGFGLESWKVEDGNVAMCAYLSFLAWIRGVSSFQSLSFSF